KLRSEMRARAGGRTSVPQIFINGQHVGGCDELYALDRAGKLKPMLEQPAV
ncbi:MAG TPA: glutaredoxin domain-containing protein, partial [Dongiaceae bacterium]